MDSFHSNELILPLLQNSASDINALVKHKADKGSEQDLNTRVWIETKKLWHIVGPSIFSRVASYSMNIVTQAFAGHLGEVELASISIANTVILGFNFGLLVRTYYNFFIHFSSIYCVLHF